MFMISQLVVSIVAKNETSPDNVLAPLSKGIKQQYPEEEAPDIN